jgi:hypothetical protein
LGSFERTADMPKFNVILTRDLTESVVVTVDAATADDAGEAAIEHIANSEEQFAWETDDNPAQDAYVTSVDPHEDCGKDMNPAVGQKQGSTQTVIVRLTFDPSNCVDVDADEYDLEADLESICEYGLENYNLVDWKVI